MTDDNALEHKDNNIFLYGVYFSGVPRQYSSKLDFALDLHYICRIFKLNKMKKYSILCALGLFIGLNCYAQEIAPVETETHIFWDPRRSLVKDDFEGDGSSVPTSVSECEELGLCTIGFFGLWSILDVPNKRLQRRGIMEEKIYFLPAFEKSTSYILCNDTLGIKYQQLIFDLMEVSARMARQKLQRYQDEVGGGTGMKAIMFKTVEAEVAEFRRMVTYNYYREVFKEKKDGAYENYRKLIDDFLEESKDYATSSDDRKRYINNGPIIKNYKQAEYVLGNLRNDKNEETE